MVRALVISKGLAVGEMTAGILAVITLDSVFKGLIGAITVAVPSAFLLIKERQKDKAQVRSLDQAAEHLVVSDELAAMTMARELMGELAITAEALRKCESECARLRARGISTPPT